MGELALVLEVLKVEDPNRVQPFKNCFTPQQKFVLVQKREFLPVESIRLLLELRVTKHRETSLKKKVSRNRNPYMF